jgi:hypothetical protein
MTKTLIRKVAAGLLAVGMAVGISLTASAPAQADTSWGRMAPMDTSWGR